ncbi:MAG: AAA family ATPase [Thaumarchaeota archaeon]|nr:AAA family ATPase [Nitrososphaerota archaeon]
MPRIKSGITELDSMLMGGFMENDAVMLAGSAGAGKTTLALQYLVSGIVNYSDPGIYVTFEQLPDQIYRDAKNLGWDLRKMEEENQLRVICTSPDLMFTTEDGESIIDFPIDEIRPKRIVIDSLSHLSMFSEGKNFRLETYRLVSWLKMKNLSSLLLWETSNIMGQLSSISDNGLSFLVDSIILLKPVEIDSTIRKALVILKMRGSDHDKKLREYEITSKGIVVAAPFANYEGIMSGNARKVVVLEQATQNFTDAFSRKRH